MDRIFSCNSEEQVVMVPAGQIALEGRLRIPYLTYGLVLMAHGCELKRENPVTRYFLEAFREAGLATMLVSLLDRAEEAQCYINDQIDSDTNFLTGRLLAITDWLIRNQSTRHLQIGYCATGSSVGAAIQAAARLQDTVSAVVSCCGRPEMADNASLVSMGAPALLIVGDKNTELTESNKKAYAQLKSIKNMVSIPDSLNPLEEANVLEKTVHLTRKWFVQHLSPVHFDSLGSDNLYF